MANVLREPQWWPAGDPTDPFDIPQGIYFPEVFHRRFHPPDYEDWRDDNSEDKRDLEWPMHMINPLTGLPPFSHQGFEYAPGVARNTNGDGNPGSWMRWNVPPAVHPFGKKRRMAFVWPSDGKRKNTLGRWKDVLSGKGPDVFVTKLGDRPSRNQWRNRHLDWTEEDPGFNTHVEMAWARRRHGNKYDFRERRYRRGGGGWSDAVWPRRGADQYEQPLGFRCGHGEWFNLKWAPFGGVPMGGYNVPPIKRSRFCR